MSTVYIERDLKQVAQRFWRWEMWRNLTYVWLGSLLLSWMTLGWSWSNAQPWPSAVLLVLTLSSALFVLVISWIKQVDLRWVAREIEVAHPELQTKLLAAFEQEQQTYPGERGFLQRAVIEQATSHSLLHGRWQETMPSQKLWAWSSAHWVAFVLLLTTFATQTQWASPPVGAAISPEEIATRALLKKLAVAVEPGNVELERGSDLLVIARFANSSQLPREVTLHTKSGAHEESFKMQQSLSDPIFAVRVPELKKDLTYRLTFNTETTPEFHATIFDYPELERADAELQPPSYTNLPERRVEDVRQFSVVEGTNVRLICRVNKPLASASLFPATGESINLVVDNKDQLSYSTSQVLKESVRWKLELTDDKGRKNRQNVEFVIDVIRNVPPEIKLVFPKRDLKVSPLQEVSLESEIADDFGVLRWGLAYEMTGRKQETVTFGEKLAAHDKQTGQRVIALEDLKAKADELLAWHVWAEDLGPDGKVRRTTSDIFFAEVSPFEEIFREQASGEGEGQPMDPKQQNPVNEAAQKQKEIVTAIWNLRRREQENATPSSKYAEDAKAIAEGQQKIIASLSEMAQKLQSPDAAAVVAEIEQHMNAALQELTTAATTNTVSPLDQALPAAQAAYQSLLKLRARENRVMKSKSSSSSSSASQQSAAGQELDQLEMNQDEQRYETKKNAADAKQTPAQNEREQVMNRLRELARRQEDTNQKVKELQAALEAAKNEEEKKQLERQLKRLRDEQRDLLRDVDQLKNKVDKPEHNQPLAEASKQLQETRENARQASDALEKGQTQQALAAGTRAENSLDKLREDFRKQNSSQVADEVRDLVDQAKQLEERQQKIGEQLAAGAKNQPPRSATGGLRPSTSAPTTPKLAEELAEQKKQLNDVLDKAKNLTERVEGNEPLLSKQLYDTVREAHQKQTPRAVDMMRQLADSGMPAEASKLAPQAEKGVKQLRAGIEKAAEGVLGNDLESLRRAKREVDRLAQALSSEMRGQGSDSKQPSLLEEASSNNPSEKSTPAAKQEANKSSEQPTAGNSGDSKSDEGKSSAGKKPSDKPSSEKSPAGKQGGEADNQPMSEQGKSNSSAGESKSSESGKSQGNSPQGKSDGKSESQSPGQQSPSSPSKNPMGQNSQAGQSPGGKSEKTQEGSPMNPAANQSGQPSGQPGEQNAERQASTQTGSGPHGVLTGPDWREWSDALRNVEEFVPSTRMRSEAARVREQAQAIRAEFKRHSKAPNWDTVRETIYEPLVELQKQLDEELLRRSSPEAAVPLDRDPVPDKFGDAVKRYYERLGSGQ